VLLPFSPEAEKFNSSCAEHGMVLDFKLPLAKSKEIRLSNFIQKKRSSARSTLFLMRGNENGL
jgi:hypothetical protein